MKLIAGLGNPGKKYELTRHNTGFILIDLLTEFFNIKLKAGKGNWLEGKGIIEEEEVYILKPTTYMNDSGVAIKEFIEKNNFNLSEVLIVVDDFQIPLGTIRLKGKGSDGGHNGLANIMYHLNTDEFPRMRIGIGRNELIKNEQYVDYVLSNFEEDEIEKLKKVIPVYVDCIKSFIKNGLRQTMNEYNKSFLENNIDSLNKNSKENLE